MNAIRFLFKKKKKKKKHGGSISISGSSLIAVRIEKLRPLREPIRILLFIIDQFLL